MYVVSYCPIAKIFQKRWSVGTLDAPTPGAKRKKAPAVTVQSTVYTQEDLVRNPERIFVEEPFTITVERDSGDLVFTSGAPKNLQGICKTFRLQELDLFHFLTGGETGISSLETCGTGLVGLNLDGDTEGAITFFLSRGMDPDERLRKTMTDAAEAAKELSKKRVMEEVRRFHRLVKQQYENHKTAGTAAPEPSNTGFLCAYVLEAEETRNADERAKLTEAYKKLMEKTFAHA